MSDKEKKGASTKESASLDTGTTPSSSELQTESVNASDLTNSTSNSTGSPSGSSLLLKKDGWKNERFPMLDVVFDKFVQYLSLTLRNLLQTNTEARLMDVHSITFNEYLDSNALPAMFNIFNIEDWESSGIITINASMIYSLINILLGGKKYNRTSKDKTEGRTFSRLEFNLVERFIKLALDDLKTSFAFLYPLSFSLERQESTPKLIGTISNTTPVIVCSIKVDMGEFSGKIDLIIPHTSLDPIREELLKKHVGETFGHANAWRSFLTQELLNANIEMSAVLIEEQALLSDVLAWKPGTMLNIEMHKLDEIVLRCDDIPLVKGKLGHHNGMIAIEIEEINLDTPPQ